MLYPSIITHMMSGIFVIASIIFGIYSFSKLKNLDTYRIFILILLITIALGVHGISHLLLEKEYKFVPFYLWKLPVKHVECPCMSGKCPCMSGKCPCMTGKCPCMTGKCPCMTGKCPCMKYHS
jgi:hypothetical protein